MPRVCYTLAQRRAKPCAFCLWRMQQKPDDQNVPKDMPSCVDTRKLLEDGEADDDSADQPELPEIGGGLDEAQLKSLLDAGVITQEQYDTLLERLTGSGDAA